jgi:spermidine dehydrogenase
MKGEDRQLGMDRPISRRDFLNGVAAAAAGVLAAGGTRAAPSSPPMERAKSKCVYPPLRTGARGSHPGSFEVAHQLGRAGRRDFGSVLEADSNPYDLIVVGTGISGLSAAHFYRKQKPNARILLLDNHDDFGGHARRNEFQVEGRTLISHGGSQSLQEPAQYSDVTKGLLRDLGVETKRFEQAYVHDFYRKNGLEGGTYFDRETYGADRVVRYPIMDYSNFIPLAPTQLSSKEAVAQMPLGENAKRELLQLLSLHEDRLPHVSASKQEEFLWRLSYRDLLTQYLGVTDPEILALFQGLTADMGTSIEHASALGVTSYLGLPGLNGTSLADYKSLDEPYIYHFPDGNASIARLLVRSMIPRVAPGTTMEDVVLAPFDYDRLDEADSEVRLRLESTVVRVEHDGAPGSAKRVGVTYVRGGRAYRVWGRACVLAGYNMMIRYLCPELPKTQRDALARAVKTPIIYTSVALKNWRAWKKLGLGYVASPGSYYAVAMLEFPVNLGGYRFAENPDDPIVVHMERFPKGEDFKASQLDQLQAGRYEIYETPFETVERKTRRQLAGILSGGGFDPAEDIAAITVNRWAHGYASWSIPPSNPEGEDATPPHLIGRRRFGRIAIANSDAGARASIDAAVDQAHRAIEELGSA